MIDWEQIADSLVTRVNDLVDTLAAKMNVIYGMFDEKEDKANKKQHLNSIDGDHYPSIPAVNEGLSQLLISANGYTDDEINAINDILNNKVDKVAGKGLSTNDFTDALKTKLQELESSRFLGSYPTLADLELEYPTGAGQTWHANKGGWYADVGVEGEDDIRYTWDVSDLDWVASGIAGLTPEQVLALLLDNADVNILTDAEQLKLGGIEDGAQVNVLPDWEAGSGDVARILNKPTKLGDFDADGFAKEAWVSDTFFGKIGSDVPDLDVIDRFTSMKAQNTVAQSAGFLGSGSGFTLGYDNANKTQIWLNNSGTLQYRRMSSGVWQNVVTVWDNLNLVNPATIDDIQDAIVNGATYTAGTGLELNDFEFKLAQAVLDNIAKGVQAKESVDGLEIGGRNYILESLILAGDSSNTAETIGGDRVYNLRTQANKIITEEDIFEENTQYVIRYWLEDLTSDNARIFVRYTDDSFVSLIDYRDGTPFVTDKNKTVKNLYFSHGNIGRFTLKNPKLEKGNKATDWTPAPEDQVTDFEEENEDAFSYLKNKDKIASKTWSDDRYVQQTRVISAGYGLTGGGNLTANRTISLSSATQSDIAKGVTAHGWGNHADAGYLTEHQNLDGYATEGYVDQAIQDIPDVDLSDYYTKLEVDTNFAPAQGYPDWALQLTDLLNF